MTEQDASPGEESPERIRAALNNVAEDVKTPVKPENE